MLLSAVVVGCVSNCCGLALVLVGGQFVLCGSCGFVL